MGIWELSADLGNDGIYDEAHNVASSELEVSPYWLVDLTRSCYVTSVVFFNLHGKTHCIDFLHFGRFRN